MAIWGSLVGQMVYFIQCYGDFEEYWRAQRFGIILGEYGRVFAEIFAIFSAKRCSVCLCAVE